jgi:peptidyl-prolyl cis-trans isomerase C
MRCSLAMLALGFGLLGCERGSPANKNPAPSEAERGAFGLTAEQAGLPLAKVGGKTITLGDFAAVLERMDPFERLRYQSPERRRLLLEELVKVELLAQEARRRGLDKDPDVVLRRDQALRDELRRHWQRKGPTPESISEAEARAYYSARRAEFSDPERRRLAVIELGSKAKAALVLKLAQQASPSQWGLLVERHSIAKRPKVEPPEPLEFAGEVGIVSLPGEKGDSGEVPEAVRRAGFQIAEQGGVHPEVVEASGRFFVVRLLGKTPPRERTFAEVERTIRVALVEEKLKAKEIAFAEELRQRYPVKVDSEALRALELEPKAPEPPKPEPKQPKAVEP